MIVMFDLESTLIDSWHSGQLLIKNFKKIEAHLLRLGIFEGKCGLFSFAVDNDDEAIQAHRLMASHIKDWFNLDLDERWIIPFNTVSDIVSQEVSLRKDIEKWEFVNLFGKELSFQIFTRIYDTTDFILFDDLLSGNTTIERQHQFIRMIKI